MDVSGRRRRAGVSAVARAGASSAWGSSAWRLFRARVARARRDRRVRGTTDAWLLSASLDPDAQRLGATRRDASLARVPRRESSSLHPPAAHGEARRGRHARADMCVSPRPTFAPSMTRSATAADASPGPRRHGAVRDRSARVLTAAAYTRAYTSRTTVPPRRCRAQGHCWTRRCARYGANSRPRTQRPSTPRFRQ